MSSPSATLLSLNKELEQFSNEIFEFNKLYGDYTRLTFNPHAYEITKKELNKHEKRAETFTKKAQTPFEQFTLKHIISCLKVQKIFMDYFSNPETTYTIMDVVDAMHGPGTFEYLENEVKNMPFKEQWERLRSTEHLRLNVVRNDTPEARQMIEAMVAAFKTEMLEMGKKLGFVPQDYDFEFILLPPFGNQRSNFRVEVNRLELNPNSFVCLKEDSKYRIQPAMAYIETAHELLGHGGNTQFSLALPKCLQLGGMNIANLASKSISEGIATDREKWGVDHLKEIKNKIQLDDRELHAVLIDHEIKLAEITWSPYYTILKERELLEKGFDAAKYMTKKKFPYYYRRDTRWLAPMHPTQALFEFAYIAGYRHVQATRKRIEKELGKAFAQKHEVLINKTLATGNWSWELYADFVLWYVKELTKDDDRESSMKKKERTKRT